MNCVSFCIASDFRDRVRTIGGLGEVFLSLWPNEKGAIGRSDSYKKRTSVEKRRRIMNEREDRRAKGNGPFTPGGNGRPRKIDIARIEAAENAAGNPRLAS